MQQVIVDLGPRSHPIYIGQGVLDSAGETCVKHGLPSRLAVVTDKIVAALHLRALRNSLRHHGFDVTEIVIPAGERQKSLSRANRVFTKLADERFSRASAIVSFGGGVVGDLAGFVAAAFRRGIPLVHIPTTLLGQVESAVGGKVAVNHADTKNVVGAFHQPRFVLSDIRLLSTLPRREIVCGMGELLKYAYLDEGIFKFVDEYFDGILGLDSEVLQEAVVRCNTLKARLIEKDERELDPAGGRMVLNLGHTIGQPLEVLSSYKLHHGEAVLIGLRWELLLAQKTQLIGKSDFERINSLLHRVAFKPRLDFFRSSLLLQKIYGKESRIRFVLPKRIGEVVVEEIDAVSVRSVLKELRLR